VANDERDGLTEMASVPNPSVNVPAPVPVGSGNRLIRRFNRAILNPVMLRIADRLHGSYPAVVTHVGRRSGRLYRTPVVAWPMRGGFIIPLPYGVDTDWCRNVQAAGHCTLERSGETFDVGSPDVVAADEVLPLVPDRVRRTWQRFRIQNFLQLRIRMPGEVGALSTMPARVETTDLHTETLSRAGTIERGRERAMNQEEAKRRSERVTGVSNVAYDLMVVLTNKLEGVAAMEEYKLDADAANDAAVRAAFERIEQRERQSIEELRGLLIDHLQRIQLQ
jgi:deazaflavin-dependent oxidoreductase (nitroreductase family)